MASKRKTTISNPKRGVLRLYKSYMFREKDPVIDAVRTCREDAQMSYKDIQEHGGPTAATVRNWERGSVRRPQFTTVWASLRAMGKGSIKADTKGYPRISE